MTSFSLSMSLSLLSYPRNHFTTTPCFVLFSSWSSIHLCLSKDFVPFSFFSLPYRFFWVEICSFICLYNHIRKNWNPRPKFLLSEFWYWLRARDVAQWWDIGLACVRTWDWVSESQMVVGMDQKSKCEEIIKQEENFKKQNKNKINQTNNINNKKSIKPKVREVLLSGVCLFFWRQLVSLKFAWIPLPLSLKRQTWVFSTTGDWKVSSLKRSGVWYITRLIQTKRRNCKLSVLPMNRKQSLWDAKLLKQLKAPPELTSPQHI